MAGVYKRKSDKDRGKAGRWTCWWIGEDGKRKAKAGTTDRAQSLAIAQSLEAESLRIRTGQMEPGERARREASLQSIADHVGSYQRALLAKGGTEKHAKHTAGVLIKLLANASITSTIDLAPDRIQEALGRLRAEHSPRTANFAMGAMKAFAKWLENTGKVRGVPGGIAALKPYNQAVDRELVRRTLTRDEVARLLAATATGPDCQVYGSTKSKHHRTPLTGPTRVLLYRLALGTGFRANEIRSLTPESFRLESSSPVIVLVAGSAKNRKPVEQPIARDLAAALTPFVQALDPGKPAFQLPWDTADMLRADLALAGIPFETAEGVVDFHALRHTYITHLVQSGANVAVVQKLARHSTPTLTLGLYTHLESGDLRRVIDPDDDATRM